MMIRLYTTQPDFTSWAEGVGEFPIDDIEGNQVSPEAVNTIQGEFRPKAVPA